jgi:hypothetical protein
MKTRAVDYKRSEERIERDLKVDKSCRDKEKTNGKEII